MNTKLGLLLCGVLWVVGTTVVIAGKGPITVPPSFHSSKDNEDECFIGVIWIFGRTLTPDVEVGCRIVDVESDGDVDGGAFTLSYRPGMGFDKIKLKGVKGKENAQGELGIGYSFLSNSFLGTLGAQGNYILGGVDYLFGNGPEVYAGFNTIGKYDDPDKKIRCPAGYTYNAGSGQCEMPYVN
jgi:hypothetical protein